MNIVYVFGNGFDINMGLKTSYKDFINKYLRSINNNDDHIVNKINIKTDLEKWSDVEIELGKLTKLFYEKGYSSDDFAYFYTDISNSLCDLAEEQRRINISSINKDMCSSFFNCHL